MNRTSRILFLLSLAMAVAAQALLLSCGEADETADAATYPVDDDDDDDDDNDDSAPPYAALEALLDEYVAVTGEPGIAVAWSLGEEAVHTRTAGLAELQTGVPLVEDSLFRIGSVTKPFIAAVILQLVDEGRIGLDDPVAYHLPEYTQWPGLTVRHLLAMRSGITDYLGSFALWLWALTHPDEPFTPEQLVGYALDMPPDFPPGADCNYSDTNYVLLGMIIERVTGDRVANALRDRIFDPLGLSATFLDEAGSEIPDLAHGYADAELAGPLLNIDESLLQLIDRVAPHFLFDGRLLDGTYLAHPTFAWTAGGLVSSPRDVATFLGAWAGGELASAEAMAEVMDFGPCEILGGGVEYGLGLEREDTAFGEAFGHGGLHFGYATETRHFPGPDLTYAVVNNFLPEQLWYIRDELIAGMLDPTIPAGDACRPPDGFLEEAGENLLQVRFRGRVADLDSDGDIRDGDTGLSGTKMQQDGVWSAYNGYGAYAYANGSVLTIESIGPARTGDWDARNASLDLAPELFTALDADGYAEIESDRLDLFASLVYDTDEDAQPGVTRMCFYAVPDPSAPSRFFACDYDPVPADPGDAVKVFANVPMTLDDAAIDSYVSRLGMSPCICLDAEWNWVPC